MFTPASEGVIDHLTYLIFTLFVFEHFLYPFQLGMDDDKVKRECRLAMSLYGFGVKVLLSISASTYFVTLRVNKE